MKKILSVIILLFMFSPLAFAIPSKQGTISATDVEATTTLGGYHVVLVNDGPNEVFVAFNKASAATTSDFKLDANESVVLDSNDRIDTVRHICSTGETASVRYVTWN